MGMRQTKQASHPAPSVRNDAGGGVTGNESFVTVNDEALLSHSRKLTAGINISINDKGANDEIIVSNPAPENTSVANIGAGNASIFRDMTGDQINLRTLKEGANIIVSEVGDDITISNNAPENTSVANVGTGEGESYRDMTGDQINLKTVKAGSGIAVTNNADDITIAFAGGATCTWYDKIEWGLLSTEGISPSNEVFTTPDLPLRGFEFDNTGKRVGFLHGVHDGYNSGTIQAQMAWFYDTVIASSVSNTLQLQLMWQAHDSDLDTAFTSTTDFTLTPSVGAKRLVVSDWITLNVDGSYAARSLLKCRLHRTDSNANNPFFGYLKLRYPIVM